MAAVQSLKNMNNKTEKMWSGSKIILRKLLDSGFDFIPGDIESYHVT